MCERLKSSRFSKVGGKMLKKTNKKILSCVWNKREKNRPITRAFNVYVIENRNNYGPVWLLYSPARIKIH